MVVVATRSAENRARVQIAIFRDTIQIHARLYVTTRYTRLIRDRSSTPLRPTSRSRLLGPSTSTFSASCRMPLARAGGPPRHACNARRKRVVMCVSRKRWAASRHSCGSSRRYNVARSARNARRASRRCKARRVPITKSPLAPPRLANLVGRVVRSRPTTLARSCARWQSEARGHTRIDVTTAVESSRGQDVVLVRGRA